MKIYCYDELSQGITPKDIQRLRRQVVGKDYWVLFEDSDLGTWDYKKILEITDSEVRYLSYDNNIAGRLLVQYRGRPEVSEQDFIAEVAFQKYDLNDFMRFEKLWVPFTVITTEELVEDLNELIRQESERWG